MAFTGSPMLMDPHPSQQHATATGSIQALISIVTLIYLYTFFFIMLASVFVTIGSSSIKNSLPFEIKKSSFPFE